MSVFKPSSEQEYSEASQTYVCKWSVGRTMTGAQGSPHLRSPPLIIEALSLCACGTEVHSSAGGGGAPRRSYVEAFPAATRSLDVGIVEDKLAGELRLHKVHLSSQEGQLSLLLDKHPHAILHHFLISFVSFFGVIQCVGQPITAARPHPDLQTNIFRLLLQQDSKLIHSCGSLVATDKTEKFVFCSRGTSWSPFVCNVTSVSIADSSQITRCPEQLGNSTAKMFS